MKKDFRTIKIGHGAYPRGGSNALAFVVGKAAAVRELRSRGFKRDDARALINQVSNQPNGYVVGEVDYKLTEVQAMNTEQAWEGYPTNG
jgi:hypothetical protein